MTWWQIPVLGRDDLEVVERALAPAQEGVALAVPLELELGVAAEREPRGELVDLHGVVDHELGREQRVDLRRVAAEVAHRVAHRGEVDDAGTPVKSCSRTRAGVKEISRLGSAFATQAATASTSSPSVAVLAEHVLEQDPQRVGQPRTS